MCTVSAHERKQTLYIGVLQSVLLLYLPHHLCNIRSPHSYLSPPGESSQGTRQKTPFTLVCQSTELQSRSEQMEAKTMAIL